MTRQPNDASPGSAREARARPLRLLWIGTKAPLPAKDGGRLVAHLTIEALRAAGVEVTVIVPGERDGRVLPWLASAGVGAVTGAPATLVRHARPAVRRHVAGLVAARTFDVVHVEQLQALSSAAPAQSAGLPIVLRMHNVESAVWALGASSDWWPMRWARRREVRRLRAAERLAFAQVDRVVTLSDADRQGCVAIAPDAQIRVVPPPMAVDVPLQGNPLPGSPACVWLGSGGWSPNALAVSWLLDAVWPAIAARRQNAELHVFGGSPTSMPRVHTHPAALSSAAAFAADSILLLPLPAATGIRMRLLEAWARGIPVVASHEAVRGLAAVHDENVLLADTPEAFGAAVSRLASQAETRSRLVAGGRATIARQHDPLTVASRLIDVYAEAIAQRAC